MSYLMNRKQRVKVGDTCNDWIAVLKGVPQGSILDSNFSNVFINDIFYATGNLYNYADKFQAIVLENKDGVNDLIFDNIGSSIKPTECVNLRGVYIDDKLSLDSHISIICAQAARQLNSLHRISKFLKPKTRMLVFNCFILSNINYCPLIWRTCKVTNTHKMEKNQERGLRIICNYYVWSNSQTNCSTLWHHMIVECLVSGFISWYNADTSMGRLNGRGGVYIWDFMDKTKISCYVLNGTLLGWITMTVIHLDGYAGWKRV